MRKLLEAGSNAGHTSVADRTVVRRRLLRQLMEQAPFQPATNFWRAIELPVLAEVLPRTGRCLDVGCGDGVVTRLIAELVDARWELVGVDIDPAETALAMAGGSYATVHRAPADRIPEPDASFDFAFSNSVLEHIVELPECLREIARCLKPGGMLYATVPSVGFYDLVAGPGPLRRMSRAEYLAETDRRLAVVHCLSLDQWSRLLNGAGMELAASRGYLTGRQVRRWETWANWTGGLLYRLRGAKQRPIEIQRGLGLRRALPRPLRCVARPMAWAAGRGVLDEDSDRPEETGCLLIVGRKPA